MGKSCQQNTNRLIWQYFLKGTDFGDITQEQVMRIQNSLNSRPKKRFGYMTPRKKYKSLTNKEFDAVALST